jgi:hypothetical protein
VVSQSFTQCAMAKVLVMLKGAKMSPLGRLWRKISLRLMAIASIGMGFVGQVFGKSHHFGRFGQHASKCLKELCVRYVFGRGKLCVSLAVTRLSFGEELNI